MNHRFTTLIGTRDIRPKNDNDCMKERKRMKTAVKSIEWK